MYKSIILPSANEDIREATLWYNEREKGLGTKFISEVREKINFIKQYPKAVNYRYDNVRTAVLKIFPFIIHYTVDDSNKIVVISAVFHTSRNPDFWIER